MRGRLHNLGPIGVDIGARGIRAVQLKQTRTGFELTGHMEIAIAPSDSEDEERILGHLKPILADRRFSGRRVSVCVPDAALEIKNMRLPQMPEADLMDAALFEARERFVNLRDGYAIRAIPAGMVGTGSSAQQEIIVLAAVEQAVEARINTLTKLGVTVTHIEPTATAFFRPYEQFLRRSSDADVPNAFVDFGERDARILISHGDNIAFLKTCPIGAHRIDAAIAKELVLPAHDATKLRMELSARVEPGQASPQDSAIENAMRPVVEQLGKEVALCLRYYAVTFRAERPDHVTLAGEAGSAMVGRILSEALQAPVHVGKALGASSCESAFDAQALETGLPQWTTALGLAMHEDRFQQRQKAAS